MSTYMPYIIEIKDALNQYYFDCVRYDQLETNVFRRKLLNKPA